MRSGDVFFFCKCVRRWEMFSLVCAAQVPMVVERNPMERKVARRRGSGKGQGDKSEDDEGQATSKLILTERNPWLTPTESCATEQEEERIVRAPLASDPTRDTTCTVPVRWARERGEPLAPKLQTNEI